jgi:hypothetical protein
MNNLRAFLDGKRIPVLFVERANGGETRQVNAAIPPATSGGVRGVTVGVANIESPPASLRVFTQ